VVEAARNAVNLYAQIAPSSADYVGALNQLGNVYSSHMEDAPAAKVYTQAIGVSESLPDPDQAQLLTLYGNLAESRLYLGEFDAAEHAYARVVSSRLRWMTGWPRAPPDYFPVLRAAHESHEARKWAAKALAAN